MILRDHRRIAHGWQLTAQLLLAAVGLIVGCGPKPEKPMVASNGKQANAERQVLAWLGEVSFRDADNPRAVPPQTTQPSYEAWLRKGKQIAGAAPILNQLLASGDPRADGPQVAYALGWLGNESSVPVLLQALRSDEVRLRIEAAASLGRLGDAKAIPALCNAAAGDRDANVRGNAVVALGAFHGDEVQACLERALRDENAFVREMAARAIKRP